MREGTGQCPHCGELNRRIDRVCWACGWELRREQPTPDPWHSPQSSGPVLDVSVEPDEGPLSSPFSHASHALLGWEQRILQYLASVSCLTKISLALSVVALSFAPTLNLVVYAATRSSIGPPGAPAEVPPELEPRRKPIETPREPGPLGYMSLLLSGIVILTLPSLFGAGAFTCAVVAAALGDIRHGLLAALVALAATLGGTLLTAGTASLIGQ